MARAEMQGEGILRRSSDQFAIIRAIRTIGITGMTSPVTRSRIATTIFSVRLDSCHIECHISSIACAVRWINPAIAGTEGIERERLTACKGVADSVRNVCDVRVPGAVFHF